MCFSRLWIQYEGEGEETISLSQIKCGKSAIKSATPCLEYELLTHLNFISVEF